MNKKNSDIVLKSQNASCDFTGLRGTPPLEHSLRAHIPSCEGFNDAKSATHKMLQRVSWPHHLRYEITPPRAVMLCQASPVY